MGIIRSFIRVFPFRPHCTGGHLLLCQFTGYAFGACGESTRPKLPGKDLVMRFGWSLHFGPFWLSETLWRSKRRRPRRPVWHGELPGWKCPHNHSRPDLATACAQREIRRRAALYRG